MSSPQIPGTFIDWTDPATYQTEIPDSPLPPGAPLPGSSAVDPVSVASSPLAKRYSDALANIEASYHRCSMPRSVALASLDQLSAQLAATGSGVPAAASASIKAGIAAAKQGVNTHGCSTLGWVSEPQTIAGITLPLWGWLAAALGVALVVRKVSAS
jgi:hypothetical protein